MIFSFKMSRLLFNYNFRSKNNHFHESGQTNFYNNSIQNLFFFLNITQRLCPKYSTNILLKELKIESKLLCHFIHSIS